jgi:hypothetical protein
MIERWLPLTYMLNNLNRGLGLADGYPFVLSATVVEKLRFVHDTVVHSATSTQAPDADAIANPEPVLRRGVA